MSDVPRDYSAFPDGTLPARMRTRSLLSWGSVFAGLVVALIVQIILALLGVGLGLAAILPGDQTAGEVATVSIAGAAWYVVSGILAAFAGGYIAGRAKGSSIPSIGGLHGLTSWAATSLLMLYLMTSAVGSLVGGAFAGVASVVGGAGQAVAQSAGPLLANSDPLRAIETQVRSTGTDPESLNNAAVSAVQALVTGEESKKTEAREQAATALARGRNIPIEEARNQVATLEKAYTERVEQAKKAASDAAHAAAAAAATGALLAVVALILGGAAGWFGGRFGARHSFVHETPSVVPS